MFFILFFFFPSLRKRLRRGSRGHSKLQEVGISEGETLGSRVGTSLGEVDGTSEGMTDGESDGYSEGDAEGASVGTVYVKVQVRVFPRSSVVDIVTIVLPRGMAVPGGFEFVVEATLLHLSATNKVYAPDEVPCISVPGLAQTSMPLTLTAGGLVSAGPDPDVPAGYSWEHPSARMSPVESTTLTVKGSPGHAPSAKSK